MSTHPARVGRLAAKKAAARPSKGLRVVTHPTLGRIGVGAGTVIHDQGAFFNQPTNLVTVHHMVHGTSARLVLDGSKHGC